MSTTVKTMAVLMDQAIAKSTKEITVKKSTVIKEKGKKAVTTVTDRTMVRNWDFARIAKVMQYISNKRKFTLKYTAGTISAHQRYRDAKHLARKPKVTVETVKTA